MQNFKNLIQKRQKWITEEMTILSESSYLQILVSSPCCFFDKWSVVDLLWWSVAIKLPINMPVPPLWSSSHSSLAWRRHACINKNELITSPQKDSWLNLLWFTVVLPWALALFKCAHHVQLQNKYTHSLPLDLSCWIQSLRIDCQASALQNNIKVEKRDDSPRRRKN